MSSKSLPIGFQGLYQQETKSVIGFEGFKKEYENNISKDYSYLPIQFLSAIYTEFVTIWFKIKWLKFIDNHEETFLILNSDLTGYLTVQMAINKNCFVNSKLPLVYQPECLLIQTEIDNKSILLPNSIISLENLLDKTNKNSQGKLIAIICNEKNSKIMFYKSSSSNRWSIFYIDQINSSQSYSYILSDEQQLQFQTILEQNNFISPSQLSFPLSTLYNHPIIFIYIIQKK